MPGYTKLFSRILDSTIWREDDETRILWITMLALADQDGIVLCTIPGLADRARISLASCERSLHRFQEPDKYSWSKEQEGRRIREVDGGWALINHAKFRSLMSLEESREKTRLRVAKWRERQELHRKNVTVTKCNDSNDIAEAYTEAEAKAESTSKSKGSTLTLEPKDFTGVAKNARKLARQFPANFKPTEYHKKLAQQQGVNLAAEFEQFRDFHMSKGSTFKEWDLALNTWLRRAKQYSRGTNGRQPAAGGGSGMKNPADIKRAAVEKLK